MSVVSAPLGSQAPVQYTLNFLQETGEVPKALRVEDVADLAPLNDVLNDIGRQ